MAARKNSLLDSPTSKTNARNAQESDRIRRLLSKSGFVLLAHSPGVRFMRNSDGVKFELDDKHWDLFDALLTRLEKVESKGK